LRITFYANACCAYEQDGFRLLADPWLVDGAFIGAWHHFPPLRTSPEDLAGVDALFISHLHPDHFDPASLEPFRRDIPIVILAAGPNFLRRRLEALGFTNLIWVGDGASVTLGPFRLTTYAPFEKHVFHESEVGNLLDCALLVEGGGHSVFNFNDNTPSERAAEKLVARHGQVTVAQLNYNAAGPYPSCFDNLGDAGKSEAHSLVLERNLAHFVRVARILAPTYVMPFAGAYVIGGRQWRKNRFLGTTTPDVAADHVSQHVPGAAPLLLNEGQVFDLDVGRNVSGHYVPVDRAEQEKYIEEVLARRSYPFESLEVDHGVWEWLRHALPAAHANLRRMQARFGCFPDLNFYLRLDDAYFHFNWASGEPTFIPLGGELLKPFLVASMDPRLLCQVLQRSAHWNNAEIGCHVDFVREPNDYLPDVHTLLSFLHLPPETAPP
jgi:UDP-MurNAc hydroxylase